MISVPDMSPKFYKPAKIIYIFYVAFILVIYSPVYLTYYAFSDDWTQYYATRTHTIRNILEWDGMSGRPIYGLLQSLSAIIAQTLGGFSIVRFCGISVLCAFCCFLYNFLRCRRIFKNDLACLFFPLFIALLPAIQVYAAWEVCSSFFLAILLAGISYAILIGKDGMSSLGRGVIATLLLCAGFMIYQPAAMSFLFFVFLDNCVRDKQLQTKKQLIICSITMSVGVLWAFFAAKIAPTFIAHNTSSRAQLVTDPFKKLAWFISESLRNAIYNYSLHIHQLWYGLVSIVIILISLYIIYKKENGCWKILITLVLAVGSYLPNLAVQESWASYRSLLPLSFIVGALFIIGLYSLIDSLKLKISGYIAGLTIISIISVNNIISGFVIPQVLSLQVLSNEINQRVSKNYTGKIMFNLTGIRWDSFAETQLYDEFGVPSLTVPWALNGMALEIKQRSGLNYNLADDPIVSANNKCADNCIVIDIGKLTAKKYYP